MAAFRHKALGSTLELFEKVPSPVQTLHRTALIFLSRPSRYNICHFTSEIAIHCKNITTHIPFIFQNFQIAYTVFCAVGWYGNSLGLNISDMNFISIDLDVWNAFVVIDRTEVKRLVFTITAFPFCTVNWDVCWHSN